MRRGDRGNLPTHQHNLSRWEIAGMAGVSLLTMAAALGYVEWLIAWLGGGV